MFKTYLSLTKPGIIRGNIIVAVAGFLLAANGEVQASALAAMAVGLALIIASACVFNNYIDRGIDRKMARTKKRAIASGQVSGQAALTYATVLGLLGSLVLGWGTNMLALGVALFGMFMYVVVYGIGKRGTVHGTVIGSISGAVPPVVGYAAAANQLDGTALLLFLTLVAWQMPHFYAIGMYRHKDYAAANLPVLPVKKGMHTAKMYILAYVGMYIVVSSLFTVLGYTGYTYLVVVGGLGLSWLGLGVKGLRVANDVQWAKTMFFFSLAVLMGTSAMWALDSLLP